jgi:hypothetical protein
LSRAWPFQNEPEGGVKAGGAESMPDFVARHSGVEAVVVRIGLNDAQLVLVDADGGWDRWVFHSVDEARTAADELGVRIHDGAFPEDMRVRMNARQRSRAEFDSGAYPEQGKVGPVIPYRETRPRPTGPPSDSRRSGAD